MPRKKKRKYVRKEIVTEIVEPVPSKLSASDGCAPLAVKAQKQDYIVCSSCMAVELEREVNKFLDWGYVFVGGLSVVVVPEGYILFQAMVKKVEL